MEILVVLGYIVLVVVAGEFYVRWCVDQALKNSPPFTPKACAELIKDARLIKEIPKERLRLISGDGKPPSVGDLGATDQAWSTPAGEMRLVYFASEDGKTEWEAQAYDTELEPTLDPKDLY